MTHHEAGHAAMARLFGLRLRAIRINVETDDGTTELCPGERPTPLQHAVILLAGGRAELVLDSHSLTHRLSTIKDENELRQLVSARLEPRLLHRSVEYVDALSERMDARLAACCERLVRERWSAIQRLATALKHTHEIAGPDAEALLSADASR